MTNINNQKICVVVKSDSEEAIVESLKQIPSSVGYVEIRYDYLEEGQDLNSLKRIRKAINQKAIFTCRLKKFGGQCIKSLDYWKSVVQMASTAKFDYIDVDYQLTKEIDYRKFVESLDYGKIILSYHNFNETPSFLKLKKILKKMSGFDPEVYKIATKVSQKGDADTLLKILLNKKKKAKMICLGMGRSGIKTRVLSVILGAELTFASLDKGQETADGQLSFKELSNRIGKISRLLG